MDYVALITAMQVNELVNVMCQKSVTKKLLRVDKNFSRDLKQNNKNHGYNLNDRKNRERGHEGFEVDFYSFHCS